MHLCLHDFAIPTSAVATATTVATTAANTVATTVTTAAATTVATIVATNTVAAAVASGADSRHVGVCGRCLWRSFRLSGAQAAFPPREGFHRAEPHRRPRRSQNLSGERPAHFYSFAARVHRCSRDDRSAPDKTGYAGCRKRLPLDGSVSDNCCIHPQHTFRRPAHRLPGRNHRSTDRRSRGPPCRLRLLQALPQEGQRQTDIVLSCARADCDLMACSVRHVRPLACPRGARFESTIRVVVNFYACMHMHDQRPATSRPASAKACNGYSCPHVACWRVCAPQSVRASMCYYVASSP